MRTVDAPEDQPAMGTPIRPKPEPPPEWKPHSDPRFLVNAKGELKTNTHEYLKYPEGEINFYDYFLTP